MDLSFVWLYSPVVLSLICDQERERQTRCEISIFNYDSSGLAGLWVAVKLQLKGKCLRHLQIRTGNILI